MNLGKGEHIYQFKALTDLWTGSVTFEEKDGQIREKIGPNRLITTGLLGSIRWWFEVLVRGLGGSACDPTNTKCEGRQHCAVCELFGCTGWARKFRFEVLGEDGRIKTDQIKQNQTFSLCFTPLRPICDEEWNLLDATLRLIAEYGAIGGKTVFKPTEELALANVSLKSIENYKVKSKTRGTPLKHGDKIIEIDGTKPVDLKELLAGKAIGSPLKIKIKRKTEEKTIDGWVGKIHHIDYGIVQIESPPNLNKKRRSELKDYVSESKWRKVVHSDFAWASLQHFWCINGKYLGRQDNNKSTFNQVIGRPEPKQQSGQKDSWIAGRRPDRRNNIEAESKKVFSFKHPPRTFGFVKPGLIDFDVMKERLQDVWGKDGWEFLTGKKIIDELLPKEDRS